MSVLNAMDLYKTVVQPTLWPRRKFPIVLQEHLIANGLKFNTLVPITRCKMYGHTFSSASNQVIIYGEIGFETFGKILVIFKNVDGKMHMLVQRQLTHYMKHLGAYVTQADTTHQPTVIGFQNLLSSKPLYIYETFNHEHNKILFFNLHEAIPA
jgi:hypothetical protein